MVISTGLIAKGTAGALAASAAVGGGVMAGKDWFNGLFSGSEILEDADHSQDGEETERVPGSVSTPTGDEQANNPSQGGTDTVTVSGSGTGHDVSTQDNRQANDLSMSDGSSAPSASGGNSLSGDGASKVAQSTPQPKEPITDPNATVQNQNHGSIGKGEKRKQGKDLTDWDNALIDYLKDGETNNRDIVFAVTTGKDTTKAALSTTFPSFEQDTSKKKLTITATVTTSDVNLKGSDHSEKITELKRKNENKDWTWECKIEISKVNKEDVINLENKEKLIGPDGFFNKLMKSISEENEKANKKNLRELKAKFIENCAGTKGKKGRTLTNEKISAEKTFDLEGESGETNWKIKEEDFNTWFSPVQAQ